MAAIDERLADTLEEELERLADLGSVTQKSGAWRVVVWNDPVNLMSYVTWVFRSHFGFDEARATQLMLQVHHDGRAIVASGGRDAMEGHVRAMHDYGLWATLEPEPA